MTDEERRNRNPQVEYSTIAPGDLPPEITVAELELHRVYILMRETRGATLNYMGKKLSLDPVTLDTVMTHHFHGPRANLNVFLRARPDGALEDGEGHRLAILQYTGPDA